MKDSQPSPTKAVMFAYFAHQATPLERQLIERWLNTSEGMAQYFTYLDDWERQHPQFHPNLELARQRYGQLMQQTDQLAHQEPIRTGLNIPISEPRLPRSGWLRPHGWMAVAASVLLVLGLWLSADYWYYTTLTNGYRQIRTLTLPDGSGVMLGAQSSLRYARFGFGQGSRRVWLAGEAQFRVTHQPDAQRFTVQTPDQTTVDVLGTVFVVNSRRNATRVTLQTGRIRLKTLHSHQPMMLVPGDIVTISAQGRPRKLPPTKIAARVTWYDHRFVFQDTPLTDVASQLHDTFGVTVNIPQTELMNRTVSGTFEAETADDLLQALTLMMNLEVSQTKAVYTLTQ